MIFAWALSVLLLLIMRVTKMRHDRHASILFIWITPFFVYALAESTGMFSGIIATLVSGIVFGTYGRFHLEGEGAEEADSFFDLTAGLADKAVFMLCGASTAMITSYRGIYFGCCAVVLCLLARVIATVPCGCVVNFYKKAVGDPHTLSWQHLFMMCHGGLRGGIALVLALEIDATWCPFKATILNGTFIVICTLLLFCGGSTEFFLKALGIPMGDQVDSSRILCLDKKGPLVQTLETFDEVVTHITTGEAATHSRLLVNEAAPVHTH
jgi:NhaP-type Na+/H+ or K+/H+ antiporter